MLALCRMIGKPEHSNGRPVGWLSLHSVLPITHENFRKSTFTHEEVKRQPIDSV